MSTRAEQAPPASVVAAVAAGSPGSVAETLAAVGTQVYGARRTVILGGGAQGRSAADDAGVGWFGSLRALLSELGPEASHVWVLSAGASPRPDALSALVADADRAGAVLAGSKILDKEDPELLVSVGIATDAFDIPYLGLDAGEVDAGQYDVRARRRRSRRNLAVGSPRSCQRAQGLRPLAADPLCIDRSVATGPAAVGACGRRSLIGGAVSPGTVTPMHHGVMKPATSGPC